jgi:hypothetical protein
VRCFKQQATHPHHHDELLLAVVVSVTPQRWNSVRAVLISGYGMLPWHALAAAVDLDLGATFTDLLQRALALVLPSWVFQKLCPQPQ